MDRVEPADGLIGQPVRRTEDVRLLTGKGRYGDDLNLPGQLYAALVRSPHAHARIGAIDTSAARAMPAVAAVLTGADYRADGMQPIPTMQGLAGPPDVVLRILTETPFLTVDWPMPEDRARYVGEIAAMVLAASQAAAKDAAERVAIDWQPLPAVTGARRALEPGAPRVWDEADSNLCVEVEVGDAAATAAAFARASHVVQLKTQIQRVTGVPMEPRTMAAEYDAASGRVTLYAGTGSGVAKLKRDLMAMLNLAEDKVRVVVQDMGGNFGTRNFFFPEFALLPWAARRLGRPVKWVCERSESFLSDYQGRDLYVEAELALDGEGRFLALRSSNLSNVGAHSATFVPLRKGMGLMSGVYRIPALHVRGRAALTTTQSTTPYRSAGRPEAMFVIERLCDLAAHALGLDPVTIRRRNLVPPTAMPFTNPAALTYDSGDYPAAMEWAMRLADWPGFAARRQASEARGLLRGIGIANYVEITSGAPRERTEIAFLPGDEIELVIGTACTGQGHETSFAQLAAEWLGVPLERVKVLLGDTDRVLAGGGSHSGRSMRLATIVIGKATDEIVEKGRRLAAHLLEAAEADIEFARGRFTVKGTDRSLGIFDVARAAESGRGLPPELAGRLGAISDETVPVGSFPYGAQVCEVEVDPDTGQVQIVGYAAVDDVGRAVNPLILHGQTHGGIAQGAGQALLEDCHYDPATGQMLAASFMDYAMPRADTFPSFATALSEVPSPANRLGVRSGGEGGTTPALAVVINAIVDALRPYGVTHLDMPATPEKVWRALRRARG